jgi:hypothetical protein
MKLYVELNGTDSNPYHTMGLTQNPFPQTARFGEDSFTLRLQSLGGDPIPNTDYIRRKLRGFSTEFIELCCKNFRKGEIVKFTATYHEI